MRTSTHRLLPGVLALLLVVSTFAAAAPAAGPTDTAPPKLAVIVMFDDEVTGDDLDVLRSHGFTKGHIYENIPAVWTRGPVQELPALRAEDAVVNVDVDEPLTYHLDSSRKSIGVEASPVGPGALEQKAATGDGATVAVVDTGIDATHPDLPLGDKVVYNQKIVAPAFETLTGFSTDAFDEVQMPDTDDDGHGTHVASTACGTGEASDGKYAGVAPDCKIVGLGMGVSISMSLGTYGLDWVLGHHEEYDIDIVTNSWGPQGGSSYNPNGTIETLNRELHEAGVTVLFSAGNDGEDGTLGYGKGPHAIGVASFDDRTSRLSSFSSQGIPGDDLRHPDVAAPGSDITAARSRSAGNAAQGWYTSISGTSMATPHVAGLAALLEARSDLTPDDVHRIVKSTADPTQVRVDTDDGTRAATFHEVGHGAVDAREAVASVDDDDRAGVDATIDPNRTGDLPIVTDDTVEVDGSAVALEEPHRDGDWPIAGNFYAYHDAVAGGVDPTGSAAPTLVPGGDVTLNFRFTGSGHPDYPFTATTPADVVVEPLDSSADPVVLEAETPYASDGSHLYQVEREWTVPEDLAPGTYEVRLDVETGPTGQVTGPVAQVEVVDPAGVQAPAGALADAPVTDAPATGVDNPAFEGEYTFPATSKDVFFEDDVETRKDGYATGNQGTLQGEATTWTRVGDAAPAYQPPHSGNHMWYVGAHQDGATSGSTYTSNADARLQLPTLDLADASTATLTYHLTGGSEDGFDFLRVEAKDASDTSWTTVDEISGQQTSWTEETVDLSAFAGSQVDVRFRFTSDIILQSGPGWQVDDLRVVGETVDNIPPSSIITVDDAYHEATRTLHLDGHDTDGTVDGWTLDLGDGNTTTGETLPAEVTHTYDVEEDVTAALNVTDEDGASTTEEVTFSTVRSVQVDAGTGWQNVVADDGDVDSWSTSVDVGPLADGEHTLQVRAPDGLGGYHTVDRPYLLGREPVIDASSVDLATAGDPVTLSVDVAGASGSFEIGWDLDGDGQFDDATGPEATTTFDDAGVQTVDVRAEDAEDATKATEATLEVPVADEVASSVFEGTVAAGTPDEAATQGFGLLGYAPGPETVTHPMNVTALEETHGGEVVAVTIDLTWETHTRPEDELPGPLLVGLNANDFDLYVEGPDGNVRADSATSGPSEQVHLETPDDGDWQLHVEPFLVADGDYRLEVQPQVLPS